MIYSHFACHSKVHNLLNHFVFLYHFVCIFIILFVCIILFVFVFLYHFVSGVIILFLGMYYKFEFQTGTILITVGRLG